MPFGPNDFELALDRMPAPNAPAFAAAVSGGPDSMAMLWLLSGWAARNGKHITAYTVDHGLRTESGDEAAKVGTWVLGWPKVSHRVLTWRDEKPATCILEEARAARYALIADAMVKERLSHLFLAHHRDDQAETFLTRLAKGSGLDGLAAMQSVQKRDKITLFRPLLDCSKDDLIQICHDKNIPYVTDPTNENEYYLRPRLRASRAVLEEEGLSAKRLALTAKRLARARSALEEAAQKLFQDALIEKNDRGFTFNFSLLHKSSEELVLRVVLDAVARLHPSDDYGPRLERAEDLVERILHDERFKSATLASCLFTIHRKQERLSVEKE